MLAFAFVLVGILGVLGMGTEDKLKPSTLYVEGSEFAVAEAQRIDHFGKEITSPILVRGPGAERAARRLARRLDAHDKIAVRAPWQLPPAQAKALLPEPNAFVLLVRAEVDRSSFGWVMPYLYREIERSVKPPTRAHATGIMAFGNGLERASLDAASDAEKIAFPALILILLLVLRSPVAAAIPLVLGGCALAAGRGAVGLVADVMAVDATAITTVSMMGLALGVDYGLLMVARFREEREGGAEVIDAAMTARKTSGRTVLFASATLAAAMLIAAVLSPGDLVRSLATGTLTAVTLAAALAWFCVPAALVLVGKSVDRWRIPLPRRRGLPSRFRLRPALVAPLILLLMLALAAPSIALDTGPVDPRQLPPDNRARADYEQFERTLGPGWAASIEIGVVSGRGVIMDRRRLRLLEHWQKQVAKMPNVAMVLGPASLQAAAERVRRTPDQLRQLSTGLGTGAQEASRLGEGLAVAAAGVGQLRQGVGTAASGSSRLARGAREGRSGAQRLDEGTGKLQAGIQQGQVGAQRLQQGSATANVGAQRLTEGAAEAVRRVREEAVPNTEALADGLRGGAEDLGRLAEPAGVVEDKLDVAWRELQAMTAGKLDPRYEAALRAVGEAKAAATGRNPLTQEKIRPDYDGLRESLRRAMAQAQTAAAGADTLATGLKAGASDLQLLQTGLGELTSGLGRLRQGVDELALGTVELGEGAARLREGTTELAKGARQLESGAGRLASGLEEGEKRSAPLEPGLEQASAGADRSSRELGATSDRVARQAQSSTGLFGSGYAVLAALDGIASPVQRNALADVISLDHGGRAARLLVIPKTGPNAPETAALYRSLGRSLEKLERKADVATGRSGTGAELVSFERIIGERFPLIVLALSLATWLMLVVLFRSIVLPMVAVALNLLTVGAAFGLLALLFELPGDILGDAGFIDAVSAVAIFVITFGLSIDYEVFLLSRMREGWERTGDTEEAIQYGVSRTASVITGAAVIMTAVFGAFAVSGVANLRQMGIGLATAVLLDATVVRLVILPAVMRRLGRLNWWMPAWLDRAMPRVVVD